MPTAAKSKSTEGKRLTIEFSGICTLVWNKKTATADVHLVDMASAGYPQHYAALGITASEGEGLGVRGPDSDAVVSLPGINTDIGIWNLLGTDVEILGGTGKLVVDDSKVDVTKKPEKDAESIRWLPNIGYLADSTSANPTCPTAATVKLTSGRLSASVVGSGPKVEFIYDGTPVGPARYCVNRFKVAIPFDQEIAIRLDRARVLRVRSSRTVMISNTCMCGLALGAAPDDFAAHYDVVRAARRPVPKPAGKGVMFPGEPELCWPGYVEL
jgi:hypothetical protein